MTSSPLRCHLLIGPAASGKSTLAKVLAECTEATVLSPDVIRAELYGDAADQGCWSEIEPLLHQRIKDAVKAERPVIVDATNTQRTWRLAILQGLDLPEPVQWIGWWLTTPLEQCLAWNRQRDRQVDEDVIRRQYGCLPNAVYELPKALEKKLPADPDQRRQKLKSLEEQFLGRQRNLFREEGFAQIVSIDPSSCVVSDGDQIKSLLDGLDLAITMTRCRMSQIKLHRYSRLLDLERLIFLIRLLLEFPGVDLVDSTVEQELRASFRFEPRAPLPDDEEPSFATRAAYALRHRHGACYGDEDAVAEDLQWLLDQKFVTLADLPVSGPVIPGEADKRTKQLHKNGAGFPAAADEMVFKRQFGLLRHLIHNPYEHPTVQSRSDHPQSDSFDSEIVKPLKDVVREARITNGVSFQQQQKSGGTSSTRPETTTRAAIPSHRSYLLSHLKNLNVADYKSKRKGYSDLVFQPEAPQLRTLDKDIELLIKGYGFTTINHRNHAPI